jgi:NitT/TauT family transport system ATP-binding protein
MAAVMSAGRPRAEPAQAAERRPRIEIDGVSLRYFTRQGETQALDGISLDIAPGEFVGIIGQSGCGKSTLLSIIAGILEPSAGTVRVDGQRVTAPSPRIGYMLQQDYLYEWRTILDNAVLGAEIQKRDLKEARERAVQLLQKCGMGDFIHHYPRQLSGGMRQRAALARTLVTRPGVVLLDEPFSALDSQTRLAIADEVVDVLRSEGTSVVLVTHDIGEAIAMTDRVIVLSRRPGRIRSEHLMRFPSHTKGRPTPFQVRSLPEFNGYFSALWNELDVHVEG